MRPVRAGIAVMDIGYPQGGWRLWAFCVGIAVVGVFGTVLMLAERNW